MFHCIKDFKDIFYMDHAYCLPTIWNSPITLVASIVLLFILYSFLSLGAVIYYFICEYIF